ncbi:MAG: hypothetical protein ABIG61_17330 [Planctomycetota bacterium]
MLGILALAGAICISGCKDDPSHAAAREARISSAKALEIIANDGDPETARKELEKAMRLASQAGTAKDPAIILTANLLTAQMPELQGELNLIQVQVSEIISTISKELLAIQKILADQAGLSALLAAGDKEVQYLQIMLSDDSERPSINSRIAENNANLEEYYQTIEKLQAELNHAQNKATQLQEKADEALKKAELAQGEEKARLQREAYGIILGISASGEELGESKISWLAAAQEKQDQIELIKDKFELLSAAVKQLTADAEQITDQIDQIQNSDERKKTQSQLEALSSRLTGKQLNIVPLTRDIQEELDNHANKSEEISGIFEEARNTYRKAESSSLELVKQLSAIYSADCLLKMGRFSAGNAKFYAALAERLEVLSVIAKQGETGDNQLSNLARKTRADSDDWANRANEEYNSAVEEYEKLKNLARGKDEFACAIIKNHILALVQRADLAKWQGKSDIFQQAIEEAGSLAEKARQCDANFDKTTAARLLKQLTAPPVQTGEDKLATSNYDAFIAQARLQIEQQFDQFMQMPEEERTALIEMTVQQMEDQGVSTEQIAVVKDALSSGQKEVFVETMTGLMAESMQKMSQGTEQSGQEKEKAFEQMGEQIDSESEQSSEDTTEE